MRYEKTTVNPLLLERSKHPNPVGVHAHVTCKYLCFAASRFRSSRAVAAQIIVIPIRVIWVSRTTLRGLRIIPLQRNHNEQGFALAADLAGVPCRGEAPLYAGTCSNPTGNEADVLYNGDSRTLPVLQRHKLDRRTGGSSVMVG